MRHTQTNQKGSALIGAIVLVIVGAILLSYLLNFSNLVNKNLQSRSLVILNLVKAEEVNNLLMRGVVNSPDKIKSMYILSDPVELDVSVCGLNICSEGQSCFKQSWISSLKRIHSQICFNNSCIESQLNNDVSSEVATCVFDSDGNNLALSLIALDKNNKIIFEKHN